MVRSKGEVEGEGGGGRGGGADDALPWLPLQWETDCSRVPCTTDGGRKVAFTAHCLRT